MFSEHHPHGNWVERVRCEWRGVGTPVRVPSSRRLLQAMVGPLLGAGLGAGHQYLDYLGVQALAGLGAGHQYLDYLGVQDDVQLVVAMNEYDEAWRQQHG